MAFSTPLMCIGALLVVAAAAAPLSSQEKAPDVEQPDESGDRAKRAEEEIYFGNQQNKNRIMAKKSDLSNLIASSQPQGEPDMGAEVIVHKEMPVEEDLAARAEAALGGIEADDKMAEAVEAAMQTAAEAAQSHQEVGDQTETSGSEEVEDQPPETQEGEGEEEGQEAEDEEEEEEEEEEENAEAISEGDSLKENEEQSQRVEATAPDDSAEQELQDSISPEQEYPLEDDDSSDIDLESTDAVMPDAEDDQLNQFLQEFQEQEGGKEDLDLRQPEVQSDRSSDYYPSMYQYMMSPSRGRDFFLNMPYLYQDYRRRRSAGMGNKRARRIKRDLLDDTYFNPYNAYTVPYSPVDVNDALISDPDEYVPLTEEEAEYLYKRLLDNFADASAMQASPYEDVEEEMLPYAPQYEPEDEDNSISYNPDAFIQQASSPYDEGYPYGPIDFDSYSNYVKRGMVDRYPVEASKRYFFPFSQEPNTHWGAFVPEKRDYNEAIQRLQRLAMALSDNPGPYYGEMEDYRRK